MENISEKRGTKLDKIEDEYFQLLMYNRSQI